jgi:hypothetical protein
VLALVSLAGIAFFKTKAYKAKPVASALMGAE